MTINISDETFYRGIFGRRFRKWQDHEYWYTHLARKSDYGIKAGKPVIRIQEFITGPLDFDNRH